jgi:tetratricopeptide (TPR) repeat protein
LAVRAIGRIGREDPFVQAWILASVSLIEGGDEGTGLRGSALGRTQLTRHVERLDELIAPPLRHLVLALAYEKSVWHGVRWEWPAVQGKRSPATDRVRGPITRNFTKAVNLAIEELTAAMEYPEVRAEAELRLGQVLAMRGADGDRNTALAHFRGARAHGPAPEVAYLSHLFEGRALESGGDAPGAVAAYRAALVLKPNAQAARIGLAGLLFVEGQVDEAGSLIEAVFDEPDQLDDPWALYFYGRYGEWPEWLASMREALR